MFLNRRTTRENHNIANGGILMLCIRFDRDATCGNVLILITQNHTGKTGVTVEDVPKNEKIDIGEIVGNNACQIFLKKPAAPVPHSKKFSGVMKSGVTFLNFLQNASMPAVDFLRPDLTSMAKVRPS